MNIRIHPACLPEPKERASPTVFVAKQWTHTRAAFSALSTFFLHTAKLFLIGRDTCFAPGRTPANYRRWRVNAVAESAWLNCVKECMLITFRVRSLGHRMLETTNNTLYIHECQWCAPVGQACVLHAWVLRPAHLAPLSQVLCWVPPPQDLVQVLKADHSPATWLVINTGLGWPEREGKQWSIRDREAMHDKA